MKNSNWHGGKGSGRRSGQDDNKYSDNWEKIFGKKKPEPKARKKTPAHGKSQVHIDKKKEAKKRGEL